MKILLIKPVPPARHWPQGVFRTMHVPTGLAYVASALKLAGHEVLVHIREEHLYKGDLNWDAAAVALQELLRSYRPDMVGVSVLTPSVEETAWIARQAKTLCGQATTVVVGGVHPTALGSEMLDAISEIDVVVVGEGEPTIIELASGTDPANVAGIIYRQNGAICATPPRLLVHDLDQLAPIDYDMFDMRYYSEPSRWLIRWMKLPATNLRTSRGCTNACQFCAGYLVGGLGVRFHSVDFVTAQIQQVVERFGVRGIHFEDDTLGADPNRLVRLCEAIRRHGLERRICWDGCLRVDQVTSELLCEMKAAGCIQVEYGFESASDRTLSRLGKKATVELNRRAVELTRRAGLRIFANIMIGLPGETLADLKATRDFMRWAAPEVIGFGQLAPLPGTPLFKRVPEDVRRSLDYGSYAYMEGAHGLNLTAMTDSEFAKARHDLIRYFVRPWLKRQLLRDTSPEDHTERRQLQQQLRRFRMHHPLRYSRLPR